MQRGRGRVLRACSMRHLTSDWVKGRGMLSTRRARSCAQYSNTRKMLQGPNYFVRTHSSEYDECNIHAYDCACMAGMTAAQLHIAGAAQGEKPQLSWGSRRVTG